MARVQKNREMNVRLNRNGKILNFSSRASVQFEGYSDVEVYEKDGVVAVRSMRGGSYHISGEEGRPRKALSNAQLVTYVCKKFACQLGGSLPAWKGEQDEVLFFGGMQPREGERYLLDESYTPIEVEYNRRAGEWVYVHDNWIEFTRGVRETLPERMSAYRCEGAVLLCEDPAGKLALTSRRRSGNRMLVSHALADHLRDQYGGVEAGMRLRAAALPCGVVLADSQELLETVDVTRAERLTLEESKYCTLTLDTKGTLYLSVPAWEQLGKTAHLDVYSYKGCLALRGADEGALRVTQCGYAHYVHSRQLYNLVKEHWPEVKKLHLQRHGELWLLWPETVRLEELPTAARFQRVQFNKQTAQKKLNFGEPPLWLRRRAFMGGRVTLAELERFASWLEQSESAKERSPYMGYFRKCGDTERCYYNYNPFDMEKRVWAACQCLPQSNALLVRTLERAHFAAQVSPRAVRLHGGVYKRRELWPILGKRSYQIAGYENADQFGGEVAEQTFITGVAMLTAVIYQRAVQRYPGAVFYMTDCWPAAVRIR